MLSYSANSLFDLPDVQPLSNLLELIISYNRFVNRTNVGMYAFQTARRFSRIPESVFKIKTLETLLASDNQVPRGMFRRETKLIEFSALRNRRGRAEEPQTIDQSRHAEQQHRSSAAGAGKAEQSQVGGGFGQVEGE